MTQVNSSVVDDILNKLPKKSQHPERQQSTEPRPANELTTGWFAPVDKTTHVLLRGTSSCPQASPVDNPAMVINNEDPEKPGY